VKDGECFAFRKPFYYFTLSWLLNNMKTFKEKIDSLKHVMVDAYLVEIDDNGGEYFFNKKKVKDFIKVFQKSSSIKYKITKVRILI